MTRKREPSFKVFTPGGRVHEYRSEVWPGAGRLWWYEQAYWFGGTP